ncbi:MAG TPA: alpha/beta fold hydrolase [Mycobacteriales bacterium]|nr:alpha/beta fold hydrolase [Mycobacteriales bacterium]
MPVVESDDASLWWDSRGEGEPPLLLIQGLGYTADMWHRVIHGLASQRRVVVFDNRGVGRSSVPEPPWTVEQMADDAIAVLDAAGGGAAYVFGVSMGGLIAQEVALRHPDRVLRLVLGCTHPGGREAARMDPDAAAMLMDREPKSAREAVEASLPFIYAPTTSPADIDADVEVRLRYPLRGKAYWGQLDAMRRHRGTFDRLGQITAPTLVLHGDADRLVQPANATLLADAIPGARLEWIAGASHVFWTDQPEATVQMLNQFLAM